MKTKRNSSTNATFSCTSARSAAAFGCCKPCSARAFSLMDAALLASVLFCLRLSLRLSILVIGLYIITLVWTSASGGKPLLQGK